MEYNPEIIRYLNWRYGGEQRSKRSTGLYQDAAALAKKMTEKYERIWGWLGEPDIPMRRTWSQYLNPPQQHKNITSGRKSQALGGS